MCLKNILQREVIIHFISPSREKKTFSKQVSQVKYKVAYIP